MFGSTTGRMRSSIIGPIRSIRMRLGVLGLVGVFMAVGAAAVWAASVTPTVIPGGSNTDKTCEAVFGADSGLTELKKDLSPASAPGTYTVNSGDLSVTFTVPSTVSGASGNSLDFEAGTGTTVIGVIVKDGNDGANVYDYRPDGVSSDTNLTTPNNGAKEISHVSACVKERTLEPLTAEKTAEGSFDRKIDWELKKSANPTSFNGEAGDTFNPQDLWTVDATKSVTDSGYKVTGQITIKNSNDIPVNVDVSDALDDGTAGTVDCVSGASTGTVPAATASGDGQLVCSYEASPDDASAKVNTAEITSKTDGVDGDTATADVKFTPKVTGDEKVTLGDVKFGYSELIDDSKTETFDDKFECSTDPSKYTKGEYSFTVDNEATLTGEAGTNLSDKAEVTVNCTLPALSAKKDAAGTFDRKIEWTLDKSASPTSFNGEAGDAFNPQDLWTVDATKKVTEDNYKVTGKITITNPAANVSQDFDVSDALDDGTVATIDCDDTKEGNQTTGTIPAGGSVTCSYTASPGDGSATLNTATVKAAGNSDQTATADVKFTPKVTGDEKVTLGDVKFGYSELIDDSKTETFDDKFECSTDPSKYTKGEYSFTVDNEATLTGEAGTNLSDKAEVTVNCTLPALSAKKDAAGTFDRKIEWTLDKSVDDDSHTGQAGQVAGSSNWTVNATKKVTDSNYTVTGKITITNPAANVSQSFDVSDELSDGTGATVDCDAGTGGNQTTGTIPAGGSVTCSYTASPGDGSATLNTATVKAAGNSDQTATAGVSFTPKVTGDQDVTLADPRFNYSKLISASTTKVFPETFRCPTTEQVRYVNGKYEFTVTNTATLKGNTTNLSDDAKVTVTCYGTAARTMGFWQNKNGQDIIKGAASTGNVCNLGTWLRQYAPFADLSATAKCTDVAAYVTNVIKKASASGAAMNVMLKGQMLATALDVYFSDPLLGGNKINASVAIGNVTIDLDHVCKNIPTCSILEDVSAAFPPDTSSLKVSEMLSRAASQSNVGGSSWYGQNKATQELAKDAFDAINNDVAFFSL
jgi:hypothetical protein